ncbi:MAG TPA: hypothetical protein VEU77_03960 [Candidatus Acidoferrales bacterium]|nr:hypothetical protein [Candidatus Acidoferrales bacterium]
MDEILALARDPAERDLLSRALTALDRDYGLVEKARREPYVASVLEEFVTRLQRAFGSLGALRGKRILDIACGSNSSRSPDTGERTAAFEPWFCRLLYELDADAVGVDAGDLDGERFEHHTVDLSRIGALDFLPDASFDGVQDSRLFGSPEFRGVVKNERMRDAIKAELRRQERRMLKKGGVIIHTDNP